MKYYIRDDKSLRTIVTGTTTATVKEICEFFEFDYDKRKSISFNEFTLYIVGTTQTLFISFR